MFLKHASTTVIYTLSLHDGLPSFGKFCALACVTVIRNLRVFVHVAADAVSNQGSNDAVAVRFHTGLDRIGNIPHTIPDHGLLDTEAAA